MNTESLTLEKIADIEKRSYQLTQIAEDKQRIGKPVRESYDDVTITTKHDWEAIQRVCQCHDLKLLEMFRLITLSLLSQKEEELKRELAATISDK
jgi:hypothetical protein